MQFSVITLFPDLVDAVTQFGVVRRAQEQDLIDLKCINPRDFTTDRHRTVDDRPFGGGPGMVMKADCLLPAITDARSRLPEAKVVYLTPQGKPFTQNEAVSLSQCAGLILVCGRYEGIDERVIEREVDLEYSLGDFVLSGGEIAAMAMIDAVTRLIPGVLGHELSADQDSFSNGLLDHPHYTRSSLLDDGEIPEVLKGGNHKEIAKWRRMQALGRTWERRRDLFDELDLDQADQELLAQYIEQFND